MSMLDKFLQILYRVIIIITLLVVLGRLSYRPFINTYNSSKGVQAVNNFILQDDEDFSHFVYKNSLNDTSNAQDRSSVGSITIYGINVSCSVQYYSDLIQSSKDKRNISVKTDSNAEEFGKGITIIQGSNADGSPLCNLDLLQDEKWSTKTKTFNLIDSNNKTTVYKIFSITDNLQYEDIQTLNKDALVKVLLEETEFEFTQKVSGNKITILMLDIGIVDTKWLIIGGYAR